MQSGMETMSKYNSFYSWSLCTLEISTLSKIPGSSLWKHHPFLCFFCPGLWFLFKSYWITFCSPPWRHPWWPYLAIWLLYKWWMLMVFTTLVNEITMKGIALLHDMQVRRSMCRIKQVLTERALAEEDASRRKALRNMINGMWERREKWGKLRAAGEISKRTWAERLGEIKSRMGRWFLAPWAKLVWVRWGDSFHACWPSHHQC